MKKTHSLARNIANFFHIYSVVGYIALLITFGFCVYLFFQVLYFFEQIERIQARVIVYSSLWRVDEGVLLIALIGMSMVYFFFMTVCVLFNRYSLRRQLRKENVHLREVSVRNELELSFDQEPTLGPFFLELQVSLENLTVRSSKSSHRTLSGYLRGKTLILSTDTLPTGKYQVTQVRCIFRDPLQLFKTSYEHTPTHMPEICIFHRSKKQEFSEVFQLKEKDSIRTVFTRTGTEEYFSTREYAPGDELKKIHWKNTAKNSKLMIKVPEATPFDESEVSVVVNCYAPQHQDMEHSKAVGEFLDSIIEFVEYFLSRYPGRPLHIYCNSDRYTHLQNVANMSIDEVARSLVSESIFQDTISFSQSQSTRKETFQDTLVFTLSSDWVKSHRTPARTLPFVYFLSQADDLKGKNILQRILRKKIQLRFLINPFAWIEVIKKERTRRAFITSIKSNEQKYLKDDHAVVLND